MTSPLKVISEKLPSKFYRESLNKPWLRLHIFLENGPLSRTPEHFKKFIYDWKCVTPSPVHFIPEPGNWKIRETDGRVLPVQNFPLNLKYPHEMHDQLWGGEAVVRGAQKRKPRRRRVAKFWVPALHESVIYSEILDKHLKIIVTPRALDLIDEHYGLDSYILKTKPADLMSLLALKLKKEMLYALLLKTIYPDNPEKREEVYNKYKEFIISEKELEWYALTLSQAYRKQLKLEATIKMLGPYKHLFRKELIQYLKQEAEERNEELKEMDSTKKGILDKLSKLTILKKFK